MEIVFTLASKKFLDFAQHFHETINFGGRVIEIKAGASSGFDAEPAHKGLVAMMAAAQGDPALVGDRDDVVGVDIFQHKANEARAANVGAEEAYAGQARQLRVGI